MEQLELSAAPRPPETLGDIPLSDHPYKNSTSEAAWVSVRDSGWASAKAKQAYQVLYEMGPLTLLELEHECARRDGRAAKGRSESTVIRRLSDLRHNGLAELTSEIRWCQINRKQSVTWRVTASLCPPIKLEKPRCHSCGQLM